MEKLGIACKHYCRSADNADTHHTLTINNGYVEFRAMIYGGHPGRYWSGLLEEAHFLAIGHFNSLSCSVIFKLTLIKSPHFCAVIHENNYSQRLHMDSAVAEFLGVYECNYFGDTDFPKYHFSQGGFNPMLHFLVNGQKMNVSEQK